MNHRLRQSPARPHSRWPAVLGAAALWGAAVLPLGDRLPEGMLAALPPILKTGTAGAAEPEPPPPQSQPLRFLFPKGSTHLPQGSGPYGAEAEIANNLALDRLLNLQTRLAGLPARPVWAATATGPLAAQQLQILTATLSGLALGRNAPLNLPAAGAAVVAIGEAAPAGYDAVELRLAVELPKAGRCERALELIDPELPAAADGKAARLVLNGMRVAAGPAARWREVPGPGRKGAAGPWRSWRGPVGATAAVAGAAKDMSDYIRPWDGSLQREAACAVQIIPTEG